MKSVFLMSVFSMVAIADVAKVTVLSGVATRTPTGASAIPLAVGSSIEMGDVLSVQKGNLKFELTDSSVIVLSEGSQLVISQAEFEGHARTGFAATLTLGSLWTKVKKSLTGAKFEVSTDRAVAGVRGTIFRIDADAIVKASKGKSQARSASIIRVTQGVVNVKPSASVSAASHPTVKPVSKSPRVQVAGPTEISSDEWEKKFVDLQQNQQITVGVDLWEQAQIQEAAKNDAFSQWIEKNQ